MPSRLNDSPPYLYLMIMMKGETEMAVEGKERDVRGVPVLKGQGGHGYGAGDRVPEADGHVPVLHHVDEDELDGDLLRGPLFRDGLEPDEKMNEYACHHDPKKAPSSPEVEDDTCGRSSSAIACLPPR